MPVNLLSKQISPIRMNIQKILIGIDDSLHAEHAAGYGFNLARTLNAAVGLVHITEPVVLPPTGTDTMMGLTTMGSPMEEIINPELMQVQEQSHNNLLKKTISQYGEGLQISEFTNYGSTAEGIIDCSKEFGADLIVIGTHSRTGLDRFLMGSVAEKVIRDSMIPVLVVPMKTDRE
jgi:nucleotide-binding universal stress UspA family protein